MLPKKLLAILNIKIDMNSKTKRNNSMNMKCPSTPNCVSSRDGDRKHFIEPLHFTGSLKEAHTRILNILSSQKRTRVVTVEENYIHAEAISAIMGFIDDVEFYFDDSQKLIHVRSASRLGYSDLGVNRRRMETIRKHFDEVH